MKRIVLLAAAALPLAAHAGLMETQPAPQPYTVIDVDFWGTVTNVVSGATRVGDSVSGSMRIDLRYAPPDAWAANREESLFMWNPPCSGTCGPEVDAPSGFVTTRGLPISLGGNSRDQVLLQDVYDGNGFVLEDFESGFDASGALNEYRVSLNAAATWDVDFISTDQISRLAFDISPSTDASNGNGLWHRVVAGVSSIFEFDLDRLRATARVCSM